MKAILILFLLACSTSTEQISKLTITTSSDVKSYDNAYFVAYCSEDFGMLAFKNAIGVSSTKFNNPLENGSIWMFSAGTKVDTTIHIQIYYNNKLIVDYNNSPEVVEFRVDLIKGTFIISKERMR